MSSVPIHLGVLPTLALSSVATVLSLFLRYAVRQLGWMALFALPASRRLPGLHPHMICTGHHLRSGSSDRGTDAAKLPVEVPSLPLCRPIDVTNHGAATLSMFHPSLWFHIPTTTCNPWSSPRSGRVTLRGRLASAGRCPRVLGRSPWRCKPRPRASGACGPNISLRPWSGQNLLCGMSVPAAVPVPRFCHFSRYCWPVPHPISHVILPNRHCVYSQ